MSVLDLLASMEDLEREIFLNTLSPYERAQIDARLNEALGGEYAAFRRDPIGFVENPAGLGEVAWSLQEEIMLSVLENKRTAVPACHAPGKSHIAARIITWWGSIYPPGTARILTTAPTFRLVRSILWPYIRQVHGQHHLPGDMNLVEWYIHSDFSGKRELVAEGIKPPDDGEAGLSGLHAPNQLIVVDEAGGISHAYGRQLLGLMTGSNTRLLLIGNPPIDDEGSWFEKQCERTDLFNVISIPASKTPNFTDEYVGYCRSHPALPPHLVNEHLIDQSYVDDIRSEYGSGSAVELARVDARFPKTNESRTLPILWLEAATPERDKITGRLLDDYTGEPVDEPADGEITVGADIAGGMSDELVICFIDSGRAWLPYAKVDEQHRDPQYVVGIVARYARQAAEMHRARGIQSRVRVKVDSLGLGWNIFGQLKAYTDYKSEFYDPELAVGVHFIEVDAGAAPLEDKFENARAEMWWNMRKMIEPDATGRQQIVLDVKYRQREDGGWEEDKKTIGQLNAPKYTQNARGRIQVETKKDMLKRGIRSPDRADAILMAAYEPVPIRDIPSVGPINVGGGGRDLDTIRRTGADRPPLSTGGEGQASRPFSSL